MNPKTKSKIVLTSLILILVLVIYFLPKQVIGIQKMESSDNNFGYDLIGHTGTAKEFGAIDFEDTEKHGYGYVKSRPKKAEEFGLVSFDNRLNDTAFINRVKRIFSNKEAKVYKNAGIAYALIDNRQIYIENIGLSEIIGFNDVIDLAIVVNMDASIDSVIYLSSKETPSYIKMIMNADFFSQFTALELDQNHVVDAVSGATITTMASAKAVSELFVLVEQKVLKEYLIGHTLNFGVTAKLNAMWIVNLSLLILVFALFSFKRYKKKKIILGIAGFTVMWLGFYLNSSFTYILFIKSFTATSLSVFTIAYILLILFSTVWSRNSYCKYICPFGNVQVLLYKVSPFKKKSVIIKSKHLKRIRYLLSIFIIFGYLSGFSILSEYELFPFFFSINSSYFIFGISVVVLLFSMRIPKLWCRALCPTGCVLDSLSDLAEHKLKW
ncbi:MAG: 4Fe-4S binding protein [Aureispira sp.]|nr:4Fe-4S binding protein [Aureispira sp.]